MFNPGHKSRNWDKLWSDGPLGLYVGFTFFTVLTHFFSLSISAHSEQVVQQVFDELGLTLSDEVSSVVVSNSQLQHQPES